MAEFHRFGLDGKTQEGRTSYFAPFTPLSIQPGSRRTLEAFPQRSCIVRRIALYPRSTKRIHVEVTNIQIGAHTLFLCYGEIPLRAFASELPIEELITRWCSAEIAAQFATEMIHPGMIFRVELSNRGKFPHVIGGVILAELVP